MGVCTGTLGKFRNFTLKSVDFRRSLHATDSNSWQIKNLKKYMLQPAGDQFTETVLRFNVRHAVR